MPVPRNEFTETLSMSDQNSLEPVANLNALYTRIQRCIAHIVVLDDNEPISIGTGFAFTADGAMLTAAHVIGGWPIKLDEINGKSHQIVAFFVMQGLQLLYRPAVCPFEIRGVTEKPVQLDMAVLVPIARPNKPIDHLVGSVKPPRLGDELYFGGYSDEVEFPFTVDRQLSPKTEGLDVFRRAFSSGVKQRAAGPIIKRGTVGNIVEFRATLGEQHLIGQSVFYLDNQVHSGASGGPIVSRDGTVRGIISKRMMTSAGDIIVPAGSTLGVGLEPLLALSTGDPKAA